MSIPKLRLLNFSKGSILNFAKKLNLGIIALRIKLQVGGGGYYQWQGKIS
jgi:hypothetical protein